MKIIIDFDAYKEMESKLNHLLIKEREEYFIVIKSNYSQYAGHSEEIEIGTKDGAVLLLIEKIESLQAELDKKDEYNKKPWYKRIFAKCP